MCVYRKRVGRVKKKIKKSVSRSVVCCVDRDVRRVRSKKLTSSAAKGITPIHIHNYNNIMMFRIHRRCYLENDCQKKKKKTIDKLVIRRGVSKTLTHRSGRFTWRIWPAAIIFIRGFDWRGRWRRMST